MTISSLVLTDGTTTATLTDGTNYALASGGWAPSVATLRNAQLGGFGPYDEIEEQIQIDIFSTPRTLTTTLTNVSRLQRLCHQARRWASGDVSVQPVRLELTMTGSSVKRALVLDGRLDLPSTFADVLTIQEVERADLVLTRVGAWMGAADTVATAAATMPTAQTVTWASSGTTLSPVAITVLGYDGVTSNIHEKANGNTSWLLWAKAADRIQIAEAETGAVGAGISTVVATANVASGGNIVRMSGASGVLSYSTTNVTIPTKQMVPMAVLRNSGTGTSRIRARGVATGARFLSKWINVPASGAPLVYVFGELTTRERFTSLEWEFTNETGGLLDMDYWALLGIDTSYASGILRVLHQPDLSVMVAGAISYLVSPRAAQTMSYRQTPDVTFSQASTIAYAGYGGSPFPSTEGPTMSFLHLATGGNSVAHWRFSNTSSVAMALSISAARVTAHLTPE